MKVPNVLLDVVFFCVASFTDRTNMRPLARVGQHMNAKFCLLNESPIAQSTLKWLDPIMLKHMSLEC